MPAPLPAAPAVRHVQATQEPGNHCNEEGPSADERATTSNTEIGISHVSHQCGCKPVPKNSASDEQTMPAITHPIDAFLVVESTQNSPV
jgi:hypothetical protein